MLIPVLHIRSVANPTKPLDSWGVFCASAVHGSRAETRLHGPANLYDCILRRDELVRALVRGEEQPSTSAKERA